MQRPKICARAGSAARLNAGSHPNGARGIVDTIGDEMVEVSLSASGNRSPLWVRLTEPVSECSLRAAPAVPAAAVKRPANRQPATAIAIPFLRAPGGKVQLAFEMKALVRCVSISDSPLF